ncbi:dioxygenase [Desulfuromonas versatilis]|uniref:Dioxygenase n=2 Tax=Desulfuromonas versatilis TaxID=2802975 RepID=A0ABN6DWA1_9BACT|nr:dioxygenase [Desulfuromonas versatilis]
MNLVLENDYTRGLRQLGPRLPRPEAICVVSAHWLTRGTFVSCQPEPRQIYDFYGFPQELYEIRYRPQGHPGLAARAVELLRGVVPTAACDAGWGDDHAGWSVLHHLFPKADVPVFLVSIDMAAPAATHLALGRALAPLRDEGVLILGSGNIVHNLRLADLGDVDAPPEPLGLAFDAAMKQALLAGDLETLVNYQQLGETARYAVPTPDHYYPMLYPAAVRGQGEPLSFTCEIFQNRAVSMRAFLVGEH